jgi:hypothetical protein
MSDVGDLPESNTFDIGMGYAAVILEAPANDDTDQAEESHYLIDNILTNQALAWGSYARSQKARL